MLPLPGSCSTLLKEGRFTHFTASPWPHTPHASSSSSVEKVIWPSDEPLSAFKSLCGACVCRPKGLVPFALLLLLLLLLFFGGAYFPYAHFSFHAYAREHVCDMCVLCTESHFRNDVVSFFFGPCGTEAGKKDVWILMR